MRIQQADGRFEIAVLHGRLRQIHVCRVSVLLGDQLAGSGLL